MANIKISQLTAAAAALGTQEFEVNDSGASKKVTGTQIAAFVETEVSSSPSFTGDVTIEDKIVHSGDTNTSIRFPAADTVTVETSGAERLRVDSSGNVGIGTTSPAEELHIQAAAPTLRLQDSDDSAYTNFIQNSGGFRIDVDPTAAGAGSYFRVDVDAAERIRIDSSGNVGIGTSSPGRTLDVFGIIRSDGTSGAFALGGNSSTPAEGAAIHRPAANTLAFVTASTERFRVASAGELGIGGANYGTSGQVLTSGGSGAAPTWEGVGSLTADLSAGAVGTYAWLHSANATTGTYSFGSTYAGSGLEPTGADVNAGSLANSWSYAGSGSVRSGTWRAMGHITDTGNNTKSTLFLRIS